MNLSDQQRLFWRDAGIARDLVPDGLRAVRLEHTLSPSRIIFYDVRHHGSEERCDDQQRFRSMDAAGRRVHQPATTLSDLNREQ